MSHRDETLITTREEAEQWLEMYRHTIKDPQVLRIVEILESHADESAELSDANETITFLRDRLEKLKERHAELSMFIDDTLD